LANGVRILYQQNNVFQIQTIIVMINKSN